MTDAFAQILENFERARAASPAAQKSAHWDVFPENYARAIADRDAWPVFLRNGLSVGFNDDFVVFCPGGDLAPGEDPSGIWSHREALDFPPLLPEILTGQAQRQKVGDALARILPICGLDFVLGNCCPETGSPAMAEIKIEDGGGGDALPARVNFHDLHLIYYAWQIHRVLRRLSAEAPLVVEIGGGFGGLIAKIKDLHAGARCVRFDLPEVNALQHYYLSQRFPGARLLGFRDFEERGADIFLDAAADFLILPGFMIEKMPADTVDLAINLRSMMEMDPPVIEYYFRHLHRIMRRGGLFACANRYTKGDPPIRLKDYPFDRRWAILVSQTSVVQHHIHELILQRTEDSTQFSLTDALAGLPPF